MTGEQVTWGVVVPVKHLHAAKSRLSLYGPDGRERLALAFAVDVVLAALACPVVSAVLVVTDDERAAREVAALGARVLADPGAGLNPALEQGAAWLRAEDGRRGVAAVQSDLPSLRAEHLDEALGAASARAFVADAEGTGTTLLAAAPGQPLGARFGPASAQAHRDGGAVALPAPGALRRDVDTPEDLLSALALGVGPRTAETVVGLAR